ncbi:MAG: SMC family ATPase, partial [Chloroflexi bacterium]
MRRSLVRPIRLEVQGLTSFREKAEIDFSDLDLCGITGPTGSGKSSLVDAVSYALFGEVPRVGDNIKQLISQGEDRVRVNLEFSADGGRYRVHRSTGRRGVPAVQMEHLDPSTGEWLPDADRVRDVNEHICSILGMDYDGFVRSILLPQGQFQQFLAGRPEERRKVLDGLLRLDVYQQMQQRANQIADAHANHAAMLQQQLETQYAGATPDALKTSKARLADLRSQAKMLAGLRGVLADAYHKAEAMEGALRRRQAAEGALAKATTALKDEQTLLDSGQKLLDDFDSRIAAAEAEIKENVYDVDLLMQLKQALDIAQRLERAEERLEQLHVQRQSSGTRLAKLREEAAGSKDSLTAAGDAVQQAERALQDARRNNLGAALRKDLKPGDACPVCGQEVSALPEAKHIALDGAEDALNAARAAEGAAQKHFQDNRTAIVVTERDLDALERQVNDLNSDCKSERQSLEELLTGQKGMPAEIVVQVRVQTSARQEHERITREIGVLRQQRAEQSKAIAGASHNVARLETEIRARGRETNNAADEVSATQVVLKQVATDNDWREVTADLESGRDPAPALRLKLEGVDSQLATANRDMGACENEIERISEGIKRAKDLRREIEGATRESRLGRDLAHLLRVTAFPNYIRGRALRLLAQEGSRQLMDISSQRYEFAVEG